MQIKLNKLSLENFKGIRSFTLATDGQNCLIKGVNAAGKTTLMDGFLWLLFNKDSQGKADFAIKTLDKNGQELHNLFHIIKAVLDIDGKEIVLQKVLSEKWTKKRGQARAEFTGHETQHIINGVPIQKKEWDARIQSIINESTFKLLTSPTYFNSLHWTARRVLLLQVCGDISDADVIKSDDALAALPEILGARSLEDHKKVLAAKKKQINDRLKEIPSRIDELNKSLALVAAYPVTQIVNMVSSLNAQIQAAKDDANLSALRKDKAEWEAKVSEAKTAWRKSRAEDERKMDEELLLLTRERSIDTSALLEINALIESAGKKIILNKTEMESLRKDYMEISEAKFDGDLNCPACGQALPADRIQAARDQYNTRTAKRLANINEQGKSRKADNEIHAAALKLHEARKTTLEQDIKGLTERIEKATASKAEYIKAMDLAEKKELEGLLVKVSEIQEKIDANAPVNTALLEAQVKIEQTKLAEIEAAKKTKVRIVELSKEEKSLATEYERLEGETFLMEKFIKSKVALLEDKISSKFKMIHFKMFDTLINQGISECCETTVNGVPWDSLNTGNQILGGLDIVSTLQKHYDVLAPCFLDHRESLTTTPHMDCQLISLVADENYKELTVEYD